MPRRKYLLPIAAVVGLGLFVFLLVRLMLLRYDRGDVYPPYSTLRADPLGTRGLYEALESLPHFQTERGFTHLHRELEGKPTTLFYLGIDADELASFSQEEVAALDHYVRQGGRLVLTFAPQEAETSYEPRTARDKNTEPRSSPDDSPETEKPAADKKEVGPPPTEQEKYERQELQREKEAIGQNGNQDKPELKYVRSFAALTGFGWDRLRLKQRGPRARHYSAPKTQDIPPEVQAVRRGEAGPEQDVTWKSAAYFVRLAPPWRALYLARYKPVLIYRPWGKGEIVAATDSYFLSNEALRNDRKPALLAYLAGPAGTLLFDETHLGTKEEEGVMFLVNKFRLDGYLVGLLLVAGLFLWRSSLPLVPPRLPGAGEALGRTISGKDSRSGLINLLRRNVPPGAILSASLAEWKRTVTPSQHHLKKKGSEMDAVLAGRETKRPEQIVDLYHQLREINQTAKTYAKGT